jgi:hypothetical protein
MKRVDEKLSTIINPEEYSCIVWRYHSSHSMLLIQLHKGDIVEGDVSYLMFGEVAYYEGQMSWKGAEFHIAPVDECIKLFQKLGWGKDDNIPIESYLANNRLYIFRNTKTAVRILAGVLYESKEMPNGC